MVDICCVPSRYCLGISFDILNFSVMYFQLLRLTLIFVVIHLPLDASSKMHGNASIDH